MIDTRSGGVLGNREQLAKDVIDICQKNSSYAFCSQIPMNPSNCLPSLYVMDSVGLVVRLN